MRNAWLVSLVLIAACERSTSPAGSETPVAAPPAAVQPADADATAPAAVADSYLLRDQIDVIRGIDRELASVEIAWLGEASRGDRRAAIVWPAIAGGRVIDNDVVALVFVLDGRGWRLDGREIGPKPQRDRLEQALGGAIELHRPDGLAATALGPHLLSTARAFRDALAAGQSAEAIAAAESFARGFGPAMLIYDNLGVNLLIEGRLAGLDQLELRDLEARGDTATGALVGVQDGTEQPVPVRLIRAGTGWAIDGIGR